LIIDHSFLKFNWLKNNLNQLCFYVFPDRGWIHPSVRWCHCCWLGAGNRIWSGKSGFGKSQKFTSMGT